jgi:hypothetical protein
VPETYGRRAFNLAINPLPPLIFFARGKELFPCHGGFEGHGFLSFILYYKLTESAKAAFIGAVVLFAVAALSERRPAVRDRRYKTQTTP